MIGILVDVTKCTGCEKCVAACVQANHIDPVAAELDRATAKDGLSANLFCALEPVKGRYVRKACMHCIEPACAAACPVGALVKTPLGPVEYDPTKCIGCRYCMLACPYDIPRYEWNRTMPYVRKCTLCVERLKEGKRPACVEACPHEALSFGDRDLLLRKARALIRRRPKRYLPRIWGASSWGGASVLYVSDVDLSAAGWPRTASASIPSITDPLIRKTPVIGLTVGFGLWALMAVIKRRQKLMSGNGKTDVKTDREATGD
ncbi:MAG: 4Fe-4S dicluster domain-containing protein [Acidobacteriota bacterium]